MTNQVSRDYEPLTSLAQRNTEDLTVVLENEPITTPYRRSQLPQWTIRDIIKYDYTYYFGIALCSSLKPTQLQEEYEEFRTLRKIHELKHGVFDPIIVDCDYFIICGHHRHKAIKEHYSYSYRTPIICLEGVTHGLVTSFYESCQLHLQGQLDEQARAIEEYDYGKLQAGKEIL